MNSKHTFAIIAYKQSEHLQDCIDSLKKQTASSKIIICSSTPSTFLDEISEKNELELFINPKREGIANDWNFALSQAQTTFITLAHQDDVYHELYADEMISALESRPDSLIAFSNYDEIICSGSENYIRKKTLNFLVKNWMLKLSFGKKDYLINNKQKLLSLGNPIGCPTVIFNKNNLGNFTFDSTFSIDLDWHAWLNIAAMPGSFIWNRKTLVSHRIHQGSETTNGISENRRQKEDLEMFSRNWPLPIAKILNKIYSLSYKNNN